MKTLFLPIIFPLLLSGPAPDALALFRQWSRSSSPALRIQAVRSLRGLTGAQSRAALLSLLDDDAFPVRAAVREEIVRRPDGEGPALVEDIAHLRAPRARMEGLRALLARKEDVSLLTADEDPDVRSRALASRRVSPRAAARALESDDGRTRAFALELLHDPSLAQSRVHDPSKEVRIACARLLEDPGPVTALLRDKSWRVRLAAIRAVERLRSPEGIPALFGIVAKDSGVVRARAVRTLYGLTGADFGDDAEAWREWWRSNAPTFHVAPKRPPHSAEETRAAIRFRHIPVFSRRLCFVLDASKSMGDPAPHAGGKSRWQVAVADLLAVLEKLPPRARFNVVLFRTDVKRWQRRLVPATNRSRAAFRRWIEHENPSGWTNLFDAVALALDDDEVDTLYLLTDGVPSRGRETRRRAILDEIDYLDHYKLVTIHCVRAGGKTGLNKAWDGFLEELARAHDGLSVQD